MENLKTAQNQTRDFQTWIAENFQNDPQRTFQHLFPHVRTFLESFGVDASTPIVFNGSKRDAYPIDPRHKGRVAIWAREGKNGNFTITVNNFAIGKGTFNSYQFLRDEFDLNRSRPRHEWQKPQFTTTQTNPQHEAQKKADALSLVNDNRKKVAAIEAFKITFNQLPNATSHPYAERKNIDLQAMIIAGVDIRKGSDLKGVYIVFPLVDVYGKIKGFQQIYADGFKKYVYGTDKKAAFVTLGDWKTAKAIEVCEGLATGWAIFTTTGTPTVCAMDAGNLEDVALSLKINLDDDVKIRICADNDLQKQQEGKGNAGIFNALAAAKVCGGSVVFPVFDKNYIGKVTDYDDLTPGDRLEQLETPQISFSGDDLKSFKFACLRLYYGNKQSLIKNIVKAASAGLRDVPRKKSWNDVAEEIVKCLPEWSQTTIEGVNAIVYRVWGAKRFKALRATTISDEVLERFEVFRITNLDQLTNEVMQHFFDDGYSNFIVSAPMGSGKTQHFIKPLFQRFVDQNGFPGYVCHSQSLSHDGAQRLNTCHYQQDFATLDWANGLGVCINSIITKKSGRVLGQSKAIFFDEITAILKQLCGNAINKPREVFDKFAELLKDVELKFFCDANMNSTAVELIEKLTPGQKTLIIVMEQEPIELKIVHTTMPSAIVQFKESLQRDETTFATCDTLEYSEQLGVIAEGLGKKCLVINADRTGEPDVIAFLKNPNEEILKYDCVVASPSITSGLSITNKYFQNHFAFFTGCSFTPDIGMQQIRRDRTATQIIIGMDKQHNYFDNNKANISKSIEQVRLSKQPNGTYATSEDDHFINLALELKSIDNYCMSDWANTYLIMCEDAGFTVLRAPDVGDEITKEGKKERKEAKKTCNERHYNDVVNAEDLNLIQYEKSKKNPLATKANKEAQEKFEIKNELGVQEVTKDDVKFFKRGEGVDRLRRFELITMSQDQAASLDQKETGLETNAFGNLFLAKVYQAVFAILGIDILTGKGIFTKKQISEVVKLISRKEIKRQLEFHGVHVANCKYHSRALAQFLSSVGLKLNDSRKQKRDNGKIIDHHSLKQLQFDLVRHYRKLRGFEENTQIQETQHPFKLADDYPNSYFFNDVPKKTLKINNDMALNGVTNDVNLLYNTARSLHLQKTLSMNEQKIGDVPNEIDEERAAIQEYEAGFCRNEAEQLAQEMMNQRCFSELIKKASNF